MWRRLLKTTGASDISTVLSPSFFRVFPVSRMMQAARALTSNYRDRDGFERAVDQRDAALRTRDIPVRIRADRQTTGETDVEDGQTLLILYFQQLFDDTPTLLDLRRERFDATDDGLVWSPTRYYIDWDEEFIEAVRALYDGFYTGDDDEFEAGLAALHLSGTGDLFENHFGEGDQRAVHFDVEHFHDSFTAILSRCVEMDRSLHYQFAPLGLYLASLYDHLDQLGGTYDVREAFEVARTGGDGQEHSRRGPDEERTAQRG